MTDSTNNPEQETGADEVYSVEKAAQYLSISESTIRRAVYREQLTPNEPIVKARQRQLRYTFTRAALDAYRDQPKRKPRA